MTDASKKPSARQYPTRPVVGVGAVVVDGSKLLLIRRGKAPKQGEWSLPGGAQRLGETTFEAVVREIREETGLDIQPVCILDVVDYIDRTEDNAIRFHYTLIDFLAVPTGGTLAAGSDAVEAQFFPLEEARALPLWSETRRVIDLAAEKLHQLEKRPRP